MVLGRRRMVCNVRVWGGGEEREREIEREREKRERERRERDRGREEREREREGERGRDSSMVLGRRRMVCNLCVYGGGERER